MSDVGHINSGMFAWSQSDEWRAIARQSALTNLAWIHAQPICGATARSTGLPCRKPGLGRGGRCNLHGGHSGSGDTWGVRRWRDSGSPVVARRLDIKADRFERLDDERDQRLAAMSPEERSRYNAWLQAHRAGGQDGRVKAKLMAAMGVKATTNHDAAEALSEAMDAALEEEKRAWEIYCAVMNGMGVFA